MSWESRKVTLACGCDSNMPWSDDIVFASAKCAKHGTTHVEKASRIFEAKPSKDYQLGVEHSGG